MIEDAVLIDRVLKDGDEHAFKSLVVKHQSPIRSFARRLCAGCYATADDIAQDTFVSAYRNLHTFKGDAKFLTWLHAIAHRHYLAHVRKQVKVERISAAAVEQEKVTIDLKNVREQHDILIEQLMSILTPTERVCISLFSMIGLTHDEISSTCDMPLGTVKSHINRATQKMRNAVNE